MNETPEFLEKPILEVAPAPDAPSYDVIVMPAKQLDHRYRSLVFSRWLRSLRYGNHVFKKASSKEYYRDYQKFIENLMAKPDAKFRFAVLSDDHDIVLGFSMSREDVLDYVHVHSDYRRVGIGAKLLAPDTTTFSHLTATGLIIWQNNAKYKHLKFNPCA